MPSWQREKIIAYLMILKHIKTCNNSLSGENCSGFKVLKSCADKIPPRMDDHLQRKRTCQTMTQYTLSCFSLTCIELRPGLTDNNREHKSTQSGCSCERIKGAKGRRVDFLIFCRSWINTYFREKLCLR